MGLVLAVTHGKYHGQVRSPERYVLREKDTYR